jgi:hypothetical protein
VSCGPQLAHLTEADALDITKPIYESLTLLLRGNNLKGQHRVAWILEQPRKQARGLSEIFNGMSRPRPFDQDALGSTWINLLVNSNDRERPTIEVTCDILAQGIIGLIGYSYQ